MKSINKELHQKKRQTVKLHWRGHYRFIGRSFFTCRSSETSIIKKNKKLKPLHQSKTVNEGSNSHCYSFIPLTNQISDDVCLVLLTCTSTSILFYNEIIAFVLLKQFRNHTYG